MIKSFQILVCLTILAISSNVYSQQKQQRKMTNTETVTEFLNGFNDPTKIANSLSLLADDYKFKNPMVQLNSKVEFIALAQEIGSILTGLNIITVAEHENWVAVWYEFKSSVPNVETNIATEWFRLEKGIIQESHLIYDASEWRKIYAQMNKN